MRPIKNTQIMRQVSKIFFFFLAATLFVACNDDDDNGGPSTKPTASMSTTYKDILGNTTNWTATGVLAEQSAGDFSIIGSAANQTEIFSLSINAPTVGDHYDATISFVRMQDTTFYTGDNSGETYAMVSVTEVDTVNKTISGTFQYSLANMENPSDYIFNTDDAVTPGQFTNIPYTTEVIGGGGDGSLSVDLDGTTMTDDDVFGFMLQGQLMLSAEFGDDKGVTINLPGDIVPGEYEIGSLIASPGILYTDPNQSVSFFGDSGAIVILSHNTSTKKITGTFHGTLAPMGGSEPPIQMTNGSFNITYM